MQKFCITCQAPHSGLSLECERCSPKSSIESTETPGISNEVGTSPVNRQATPMTFQMSLAADGRRKVGILLGIGIFLLPWIFAWLTLRKGYSKPAKIISFAWLAMLTIGNLASQDNRESSKIPSPITSETAAPEIAPSENLDYLCSMPSRISKDPELSKLGGGEWKKWTVGGDRFGCEGGKDFVNLDSTSSALAEFGILGVEKNQYAYITIEYGATLYGTDQTSEKAARQRYITFLDEVSMELFGEKLPEDFRANIKRNPKRTPPGELVILDRALTKGYVELKLSNIGQGNVSLIMFDLQFFESAEAYKRFKDL